MRTKSDFIFLGIIGVLIINTVVRCLLTNYILSVNTYFGFACWAIVLILSVIKNRACRYATGLLLVLATFNIINFTVEGVSAHVSIGSLNVPANAIGLNPIIFLILVVYYFVNIKSINRIMRILFYGSDKDRIDEYQKEVNFYFKKFENCTSTELDVIFNNFKEYPPEAQEAILSLRSQKSLIP